MVVHVTVTANKEFLPVAEKVGGIPECFQTSRKATPEERRVTGKYVTITRSYRRLDELLEVAKENGVDLCYAEGCQCRKILGNYF